MRGAQTDEQMNVVFHAADDFRNSAKSANCAAEIFMELGTPRQFDERSALLCGENDVVVEREKG